MGQKLLASLSGLVRVGEPCCSDLQQLTENQFKGQFLAVLSRQGLGWALGNQTHRVPHPAITPVQNYDQQWMLRQYSSLGSLPKVTEPGGARGLSSCQSTGHGAWHRVWGRYLGSDTGVGPRWAAHTSPGGGWGAVLRKQTVALVQRKLFSSNELQEAAVPVPTPHFQ